MDSCFVVTFPLQRFMWTGSHIAEDSACMEKYELEDGKPEIMTRPDEKQGRASTWKQFFRFVSI